MTGKEVETEFFLDMDNIRECIHKFRDSKVNKRLRRSDARFPVKILHEFTTARENRYIVIHFYPSRKHVFAKCQTEGLIAIITQPDGRYRAIAFLTDVVYGEVHYEEFVPHVFEQYADRMNSNKRGVSLIKEFFYRNMLFSPVHGFERPNDEHACMCTCNDGAVFGHRKEKNFSTFLTFIASNTMQHGYKAQFDSTHNERLMSEKSQSLLPDYFTDKIPFRE